MEFAQQQDEWDHGASIGEDSSTVSDCESGVSASTTGEERQRRQNSDSYLVRLGEGDSVYDLLKTRFLHGLGALSSKAEILAIQRNVCSDAVSQARLRSFLFYAEAVSKLRGGDSNVKYAWYGATGENDVRGILSNGFSHVHGNSLCLSPDDSPLQSVKSCAVGRDGVRHLILCRVILGRTEIVQADTKQCYPSCADYDSGVDSFSAPTKYMIWSSRMNTHVWPAYVLSVKVSSLKAVEIEGQARPTSPSVPFPTLISMLSKVSPQLDIALICKLYKARKERKISRHELIEKVRQIAGDKLLFSIIKYYRAKKKPTSFQQARSKNGN